MRTPFVIKLGYIMLATAFHVNIASTLAAEPIHAHDREDYATVISHLDTKGDLLVIANIEGILEGHINDLILSASSMQGQYPDMPQWEEALIKTSSFLKENGFYSGRSFGMSVSPRQNGLNTIKTFIAREPSSADLPFWKGLVGSEPSTSIGIDFLSQNTVLVCTSKANLKETWNLIKTGVNSIASQQTAEGFNRRVAAISRKPNLEIDRAFDSLGEECFLSVQFSSNSTIRLPATTEDTIEIPHPSFLFGFEIKDNSIPEFIINQMTNSSLPLIETPLGTNTMRTLNIPSISSPLPIKPTFVVHAGFFLCGSNPGVLANAITSFEKKNGLAYSAGFKETFSEFPSNNNGIAYLTPSFMQVLWDINAKTTSPSYGFKSKLNDEIQRRFINSIELPSAMVVVNRKSGIETLRTCPFGAREAFKNMVLTPMGITAFTTLRNMFKARNASHQKTCLKNLRIIDLAKEQCALENENLDDDVLDRNKLKEYFPDKTPPTCPSDGIYTINPLGKNPACSIHGQR